MCGYVYITTNLINGKIYIGQHKVENNRKDENYLGSGKILLEAVKKFGKENFSNEILCWCETEEEMNEKEIFYIEQYHSTVTDGNYNISAGGFVPRLFGELNGNYGRHRKKTESEKQHLSDIMRGHPPTFTGHHTEEAKRRISEKTLWRNLNASEEIYKKVSETAKGNKMMNKGGKCIRVHPEDFEKYLNDGWVFGGNSRKGKYANRHQKKPANYTTLGTK